MSHPVDGRLALETDWYAVGFTDGKNEQCPRMALPGDLAIAAKQAFTHWWPQAQGTRYELNYVAGWIAGVTSRPGTQHTPLPSDAISMSVGFQRWLEGFVETEQGWEAKGKAAGVVDAAKLEGPEPTDEQLYELAQSAYEIKRFGCVVGTFPSLERHLYMAGYMPAYRAERERLAKLSQSSLTERYRESTAVMSRGMGMAMPSIVAERKRLEHTKELPAMAAVWPAATLGHLAAAIGRYADCSGTFGVANRDQQRTALVHLAAVAIAGIEALDRPGGVK